MGLYYRLVSPNLILRFRLALEFQRETFSTKPLPLEPRGHFTERY
jgi:hypothetical protein